MMITISRNQMQYYLKMQSVLMLLLRQVMIMVFVLEGEGEFIFPLCEANLSSSVVDQAKQTILR
jgi:uncharacterized membrane protein YphA (DoxX/SURF4 family)